MIDRSALVGTWPDQRACLIAFAACELVALVLAACAAVSWLRGD